MGAVPSPIYDNISEGNNFHIRMQIFDHICPSSKIHVYKKSRDIMEAWSTFMSSESIPEM